MEKEKIVRQIVQAIKDANAHGFRVIVGSDEEGNNWNELKPDYLEVAGTKEGFIALDVFGYVDESEAFEEIECLHESTHSTSRGVFCADCGIELKN